MRPLIHKNPEGTPEPVVEPKAKPVSSETIKTIKVAFAIVGLLVGGLLIAWQMGWVFEPGPPPAPEHPTQPGGQPANPR